MKIKRKDAREFIIAFTFACLSVVIYYFSNNINNGTLYFAVLGCLIRSLTMVITLKLIEVSCINNIYSGAAFLLYSTVIYNSISCIKYSVLTFYSGALNTLLSRGLGSVFIDIVIILSSIVFARYHRTIVRRLENQIDRIELNVPIWITIILVVAFSYVNIVNVRLTGNTLVSNVSRTMRTFVNLFTYITYAATILSVRRTKKGKLNLLSLTPIALVGVVNLLMTMISGKKNLIVVFGITVVCGLLYTKKISFKFAKYVAYSSPLLLQIVQTFSEVISGRTFFNTLYKLMYHAFRFDLSDLAVTIAANFSKISKPWEVIVEAIEYSIPSIFNTNKASELVAYKDQMAAVGLIRDYDFNDTFFSMGAQIAGFVGIIAVFLLIVLFFEWISAKIVRIRIIGPGIMLVLISYFASCESDWSMFFFQTRDMFIYIICSYFVLRIILKVRKKKTLGE